ncbi:MAG: DUF3781 domain-containing protein [Firmicutes bacterium]|nr:DUF3781 domain-containing protein [Bacillota bacterium]
MERNKIPEVSDIIYEMVGKIIEQNQCLDCNLALILSYDKILKEVGTQETVFVRKGYKIEHSAKYFQEELQRETSGQILKRIRKINFFNEESLEWVDIVIGNRNYIAHDFFRYFNKLGKKDDSEYIAEQEKELIEIYDRMVSVGKAVNDIANSMKKKFELETGLELLNNLEKLHTTVGGAERIKKNLDFFADIGIEGVMDFCNGIIADAEKIIHKGKNWYVYKDRVVITINRKSYTIITAKLNQV